MPAEPDTPDNPFIGQARSVGERPDAVLRPGEYEQQDFVLGHEQRAEELYRGHTGLPEFLGNALSHLDRVGGSNPRQQALG
jgi:hypothetical protein